MEKDDFFDNKLNDNKHIFVFGSNYAGRHGLGAAKTAVQFWGAKYGVGIGRTGNAYAIPTKDSKLQTLPIETIKKYVQEFILYAQNHNNLIFLVTRIGCGLAGYKDEDIAPLFKNAPNNCVLPKGWR